MNRETFPPSTSPLNGDISGQAGDTTVTVIGIQRQPVSSSIPIDQDTLRYDASSLHWIPQADGNVCVSIGTFATAGGEIISKGIAISDDYDFFVNNVGLEVLVNWTHGNAAQVFVNGTPIV